MNRIVRKMEQMVAGVLHSGRASRLRAHPSGLALFVAQQAIEERSGRCRHPLLREQRPDPRLRIPQRRRPPVQISDHSAQILVNHTNALALSDATPTSVTLVASGSVSVSPDAPRLALASALATAPLP